MLSTSVRLFAQNAYDQPWRPQFHFTPARNFMNDPNGLVFYKGEYHLFYQYNPEGNTWGHMNWGHAFTATLVHHYLRGSNLATMNDAANRMGAWIASVPGATPAANPVQIEKARATVDG